MSNILGFFIYNVWHPFEPVGSIENKVAGAGWVAAKLHLHVLKISFSIRSVSHLSCIQLGMTVTVKRYFGQKQIL